MRLSDFMLISDMDGTLLNSHGEVPARNVEAIRRFVQKGGRFGIATGRSRALMLEMVDMLPLTAPCVLYNGGELYDTVKKCSLYQSFLPPQSRDYVCAILRAFPQISVFVIEGDMYYQIQSDALSSLVFQHRDKKYLAPRALDDVRGPWYKVLFTLEKPESEAVKAFVRAQGFTGIRLVDSSECILEMIPEGNNKAKTLSWLINNGIVAREQLVAIGDYYNDIEMLDLAGIGVTLNTSPADIQARADVIVDGCEHGAVADLIEWLEVRYPE